MSKTMTANEAGLDTNVGHVRVRTFWEPMSMGRGTRLVREWMNRAGQVDRFEVVAERLNFGGSQR